MPEILTKHPDLVLTLLKSAGGKCASGAQQKILTSCPADHFCAFPQGELCVYGLDKIQTMTQISSGELADFIGQTPTIYSNINIVLLIVSCLFGLGMGWFLRK